MTQPGPALEGPALWHGPSHGTFGVLSVGHHLQRALCYSKPSLTSPICIMPSALSIHLFAPHSLPYSCTHSLPPSAFAGSSNSALVFTEHWCNSRCGTSRGGDKGEPRVLQG